MFIFATLCSLAYLYCIQSPFKTNNQAIICLFDDLYCIQSPFKTNNLAIICSLTYLYCIQSPFKTNNLASICCFQELCWFKIKLWWSLLNSNLLFWWYLVASFYSFNDIPPMRITLKQFLLISKQLNCMLKHSPIWVVEWN